MSKTEIDATASSIDGIGERIRQQRDAAGMTAAQLAKLINIHRNTITNYESGKTSPSTSDLFRLAGALGCTVVDLLDGDRREPPRFAFRAHASLRTDPSIIVSARKYLRAYDEIEEIMSSRLPNRLRKSMRDEDGPLTDREIETEADTLRRSGGMRDAGPENIAGVLEGLGVRTLNFDHDAKGLDGLGTIRGELILVMLRNRSKVVERTIFSAAHELGHLVLHPKLFTGDEKDFGGDVKRYENEADKFAGHFLVPSDELVRIWTEERLKRLALFDALLLLKRVFHVSFHCLYHRVMELNLSETVDRARFIAEIKRRLGIKGTATMEQLEPDPIHPAMLHRTNRFSRLVRSAFLQERIGVSKVAELFQVTTDRAAEITADWLRPRHELVEEIAL